MLGEQAREEESLLLPVKLHLWGAQRPLLCGMSWMGSRYQQSPEIGYAHCCASKEHETSLTPPKLGFSCRIAAQSHTHKRQLRPMACCLGQRLLLVPMRTHQTQPALTYLQYVWEWGTQRPIALQASLDAKTLPLEPDLNYGQLSSLCS